MNRCPKCGKPEGRSHYLGCPVINVTPLTAEENERLRVMLEEIGATWMPARPRLALPRSPRRTPEAHDDLEARARAEWEEEQRAALTFDVPGADEAHEERVLYGEDLS